MDSVSFLLRQVTLVEGRCAQGAAPVAASLVLVLCMGCRRHVVHAWTRGVRTCSGASRCSALPAIQQNIEGMRGKLSLGGQVTAQVLIAKGAIGSTLGSAKAGFSAGAVPLVVKRGLYHDVYTSAFKRRRHHNTTG